MDREQSSPALCSRALLGRRCAQWLAAWCLMWAVIAVGWRIKIHQLRSDTAQLAAWEQASEPLRRVEAELLAMQTRLEELDQRDALITRLEPVAQPASLLEMIGRAAAADPSQVAVTELVLTTQDDDRVELRIDGIGVDDRAAERFVASLQRAGQFERVELESIEPMATASRRFAVRATRERAPPRVAAERDATASEAAHELR
jgi:hypothetical protein